MRKRTVVLAGNLAVDERHPEEDGKQGDNSCRADDGGGGSGRTEALETERGSTLVDDGEGHDSCRDGVGQDMDAKRKGRPRKRRTGRGEEDNRSRSQRIGERVATSEDKELDEKVDDRGETTSHRRSDTESGEDAARVDAVSSRASVTEVLQDSRGETLAAIPAPLYGIGSTESDTDTSDRGDNRVLMKCEIFSVKRRRERARRWRTHGSRDGPRQTSADHEPGTGDDDSTGESEQLNARIALEGRRRNDLCKRPLVSIRGRRFRKRMNVHQT